MLEVGHCVFDYADLHEMTLEDNERIVGVRSSGQWDPDYPGAHDDFQFIMCRLAKISKNF